MAAVKQNCETQRPSSSRSPFERGIVGFLDLVFIPSSYLRMMKRNQKFDEDRGYQLSRNEKMSDWVIAGVGETVRLAAYLGGVVNVITYLNQ